MWRYVSAKARDDLSVSEVVLNEACTGSRGRPKRPDANISAEDRAGSPGEHDRRSQSSRLCQEEWCPGPDSNRHGVATEGFSYPLQLSLPIKYASINPGISSVHAIR